MATSLQRRSFRFSLRTIFIVITLCGVYPSWQMHVLRSRQAILAALAKPGPPNTYFVTFEDMEAGRGQPAILGRYDHARIARSQRLLGDQSYAQISFLLLPGRNRELAHGGGRLS